MLKSAAVAPAVLGLGAGLQAVSSALAAPRAAAAPLGILLDYAAGVIRAGDLRASGALGAIRYVSDRRPGGGWMLGKPIQLARAEVTLTAEVFDYYAALAMDLRGDVISQHTASALGLFPLLVAGAHALLGLLRSLPCYLTFCLIAVFAVPFIGVPAVALALLGCLPVGTVAWQRVPLST